MNLLVVDTATTRVSVALAVDGEVVASRGHTGDRRHGELLAPAVRDVCAEAGVAPAAIDALAVDVGPGLFTGLRVGVATAKGLAAAIDVPIVPVTSLDALTWPWCHEPTLVAAVVDARRHEVFCAVTAPPGGGAGERSEVLAPDVFGPDALAERLAGLDRPVLLVGDGARRYADAWTGSGLALGPAEADHPDAAVWAPLAAARFSGGAGRAAVDVQAVYLRQADVRIGWAQRGRPVAPVGGRP